MYCNLPCITENRNISERKTTHARNNSGIRPILQRRTMLVPSQQSLLRSVTRLLENKNNFGRVIETKAKPSDQRIKLETRKKDRTGWQSTRCPAGLGEHDFISLLQLPICTMAISHLIRLASRGWGQDCELSELLLKPFLPGTSFSHGHTEDMGLGPFLSETLQSSKVPSVCLPAIAV